VVGGGWESSEHTKTNEHGAGGCRVQPVARARELGSTLPLVARYTSSTIGNLLRRVRYPVFLGGFAAYGAGDWPRCKVASKQELVPQHE